MKYRTLLTVLQNMSQEELDQDVIVYAMDIDEFLPVKSASFVGTDQDVLDPGHFVVNA